MDQGLVCSLIWPILQLDLWPKASMYSLIGPGMAYLAVTVSDTDLAATLLEKKKKPSRNHKTPPERVRRASARLSIESSSSDAVAAPGRESPVVFVGDGGGGGDRGGGRVRGGPRDGRPGAGAGPGHRPPQRLLRQPRARPRLLRRHVARAPRLLRRARAAHGRRPRRARRRPRQARASSSSSPGVRYARALLHEPLVFEFRFMPLLLLRDRENDLAGGL